MKTKEKRRKTKVGTDDCTTARPHDYKTARQ